MTDMIRSAAERRYAEELHALAANDSAPKPQGWALSPQAVRTFICGSKGKALEHSWHGSVAATAIERKFYGDDTLIERAIVTIASNRGLLLVGEPGTAKSMLSELLAAAISGTSENVIQGTAATTEDQIRYSWNYAMLLSQGPSPEALVPSPIHRGMERGIIVRFEEITRCPPEIQDELVSILSEKVLTVPELGAEAIVHARPGFNIIATANIRDRGVHEMSAALKRRFNFETVPPIPDLAMEIALVERETATQLALAGAEASVPSDVVELLVSTFRDLRTGKTPEGITVERPTTVMSTAEAVSVCLAAGIDAWCYGDGSCDPELMGKHLPGAVFKDQKDDLDKLRQYFQSVVRKRSEGRGKRAALWKAFLRARRHLP